MTPLDQAERSEQSQQQEPLRRRAARRWRHIEGSLARLSTAYPLLPWLVAWAAFLPVAIMRAGVIADSDIFWQIRTGLLIIASHSIPAADPFSWTVHGQQWTQNSWGFDAAVGVAYRLAGLPGAALACAALVMLVVAIMLAVARHLGGTAFISGTLVVLGMMLMVPFLQARPELTDYVAIPAVTMALRAICGQNSSRRRVALVLAVGLLSAIWVNLHAAALFGVGIAVIAAAVTAARREVAAAAWCAAAAVAAAAGSMLNPRGIGLIAQTGHVQSASVGVIAEWQHFDPASPLQWVAIGLGLLALAVVVRRRDDVLIAALGLALAGSLDATRIQPILVLLALPVLASAASGRAGRHYVQTRRVVLYPGAVAVAITLIVLAAPSLGHLGRPDPSVYPARVVAAIPPHCRLFNTYLLGGYVILQRPDVPVSLDSRNDLYGMRTVVADQRVLAGAGNLRAELARAGCVLAEPSSGLARALDHDHGWLIRARSGVAVLFVRHRAATTGSP